MYAYITQGRPDRALLRLTPRAQAIITQRIGVYAAPLLQPTQITTRTAQGNPVYIYHPRAIARLPILSDTDIIYFTDASGTQQRTPSVDCACVRITRSADGLHVEHHTGATIFGASSRGELRTLADAVTATPPHATIRPRKILVVVDATVDIHLTRRLGDLPLHRALESGLTTQALRLWMAFRGMHPHDALRCLAVWSISHHKGYCSRLSTVRPPNPCGLSCGAALLGRRPPPRLCTGSPVTGCFHGSGSCLPWSPMQPGRARTSGLGVPLLPLARWVGRVAPVCPTHGVLVLSYPSAALRECGVVGHLAPVHRCARSVRCVASAVSWASWLLFTGSPARCGALRVRCPRPLGSCSPVCLRGLSRCVCGVLGHLALVQRCARSVCCVVSGVSWATWLLFTGVPARCAALCVRCPGPFGSCSPVCQAVVSRPFVVLGACACAVCGPTWRLFTGVRAVCGARVPLVVVSLFLPP